MLLVPTGTEWFQLTAIMFIGLGCAPIYPCIIHSTPGHFGKRESQEIIGVQMASAYVGTTVLPPLFGLIAQHISIRLWPVYLAALLILMFFMYERVRYKTVKS